jgi:uncharacterized protein
MHVLVTGATGTIGRRLLRQLPDARVLSRNPGRAAALLGLGGLPDGRALLAWDGRGPPPAGAFEGVGSVVHLAGEPVADGRWTARRKREIEESRVLGTRAVVDSLRALEAPPSVLVCASAVGYYGDRGDEWLDEGSQPGGGFLSDVCVAWEREAHTAGALGVRVVCLRMGVVLERGGGALPRLLLPFRAGVGGSIGTGRQWVPWVHVEDVVGLVLHALAGDVRGPLNAVAPEPVRNSELTRELARATGRPAFLRVPALALRAALGEMASVVLASQRVSATGARDSGYRFAYPSLAGALDDLVRRPNGNLDPS